MTWISRDCAEIRARLAAEDLDLDAFDVEVVAMIERITGRAFRLGAVGGLEVMS